MNDNQKAFKVLFPQAFKECIAVLRENSGMPSATEDQVIEMYDPFFYQDYSTGPMWFCDVRGQLPDDDQMVWDYDEGWRNW